MFLKTLGVIFLILLGVLGYVLWRVWRTFHRDTGSDLSRAMSVLPPLGMTFEPAGGDDWKEHARLDHAEGRLKRVGATHAGYFSAWHGEASIRLSLWDYKGQCVIALYEAFSVQMPEYVTWVQEVACRLDGGSLCLTSSISHVSDPRPPQHPMRYSKATDVLEMIKALPAAVPEGRKRLRIHNPMDFLQDCIEDCSEWRWCEEQLRSEQTVQAMTSVGVKVNEQLMRDLLEYGRGHAVEVGVNKARRKLAASTRMSVEKWERVRDRLIFINERMSGEDVMDAVYAMPGTFNATQRRVLDGFAATADQVVDPLAAFQLLVQSMQLKVRRIASMESPLKTEVWMPED